jgi:hypothetical protein
MPSKNLDELREIICYMADIQTGSDGDGPVSSTELRYLVNQSMGAYHDLIISTNKQREMLDYTYTTVANSASYALPSRFMTAYGVDIQISGYWYNMARYMHEERNYNAPGSTGDLREIRYDIRHDEIVFSPTPGSAGDSIKLFYIPTSPYFGTSASDVDASVGKIWTFDSVNAWDEYIIYDVLIKIKMKTEEDYNGPLQMKQLAERRIINASMLLDSAEPKRMVDVDRRFDFNTWWRLTR